MAGRATNRLVSARRYAIQARAQAWATDETGATARAYDPRDCNPAAAAWWVAVDEIGDAVSPDAAELVLGGAMKALSIRQPFASLIIAGVKQFETRDWPTKYRGKLAIHAAKGWDVTDRTVAAELAARWPEVKTVIGNGVPLGLVLGIVEVEAVYRSHEIAPQLSELERAVGNYQPGRAAWKLKVIDVFQRPVQARGALGLWEWTA